jgi:hypothetical protein|nr:MAG TPA: hypothetical protein [Caudoviricetes sp.]
MKEYTLPEWAFLDAHSHLGNPLETRTVINHTRSASVIEIIDRDKDEFIPVEGVVVYHFKYISSSGTERLSAILHYCATLDENTDKNLIINEVLRPCAMWYCDYCAWEDNNILKSIFDGE